MGAARILIDQPTREMEREKETEGEGTEGDKAGRAESRDLDPAALLDDAAEMASGDEALLTVIEELRGQIPPPTRGAVQGPIRRRDRVLAGHTDVYTIRFRGNEWAAIEVIGDGDTDLDCYVLDQNGNPIDSDTDYTDHCVLGWTPRGTGPFRLLIRNLGSVWNGYWLLTN